MTPDVFQEFKRISERIDAQDAKLDAILKAVTVPSEESDTSAPADVVPAPSDIPQPPVSTPSPEVTVAPEVTPVTTPDVTVAVAATESASEDAGEVESTETVAPATEVETPAEDASETQEEPVTTDAGTPVVDPNAAH